MTMFFRGFRQCSDEACIAIFEALSRGGTMEDAAARALVTIETLYQWFKTSSMCAVAIRRGIQEWEKEIKRREDAEAYRKEEQKTLREEQAGIEWMAKRRREAAEADALEMAKAQKRRDEQRRLELQQEAEIEERRRACEAERDRERKEKERMRREQEEREKKERHGALVAAKAETERKRAEKAKERLRKEAVDLLIQDNRAAREKAAEAKTPTQQPKILIIPGIAQRVEHSRLVEYWLMRGLCLESAEIMAGEREPVIDYTDTCHGYFQPPLQEEWHRTKIMSARGCWS